MMEGLDPQTIIAFGTVVSVLAVIFYAFLYPVRQNQARFEAELKEVKRDIASLREGQLRLEGKIEQLHALILQDRDKK